MLIAIDTSGTMSGLAIMHDGVLLAETLWQSERRHSEQVMAQLDGLCRLVDVSPARIRHIAVCIGPGSWSGIRVGISIAKGLAIANDAAVVGINALDVLAYAAPSHHLITAIIALGRGRFATAHYPQRAWTAGSVMPYNCQGVEIALTPEQLLVYEPHVAALLPPSMENHAHHYVAWPQPRILAHLGHQSFIANPHGHTLIEPIYLGEPVQPKI